jgi:hypothetical protein
MRHLNRYLFLAALVLSALNAQGMQLGAARGSAVFGRPLDLSFQVMLDTPTEEVTNCFSADVFQADNKFDVGRVRLDVIPSANGLDATVRIRSATAVNEPWAKVILRSNCSSKITRQYDFLTDFATEIPSNNMLAEAAPAQSLSTTASAISSSPLATLGIAKSAKFVAQAKTQALKSNAQVVSAPQQKIKPMVLAGVDTKKTTDTVAGVVEQSRLKLETFELMDEHQVLLKLSKALVAPGGMRTPEEIQALAQATAVWRAINGMSAETPAPATSVVTETQSKAAVDTPLPVTIPSLMNQKLAGKSEFSNLVVYGLIGLLAMTLGCIAWLWLRVRKTSRAGYDWLNRPDIDGNSVEHEPTQFLFSNFHETETVPQQPLGPILETEPEIVIDETVDHNEVATTLPTKVQSESALSASPLASLLSDTNRATTNRHSKSALEKVGKAEKITFTATSETPIVSPLPPHFDDPRFDERILKANKKNRESVHATPITSPTELIDLVIADSPHKLRAVTSTPPVLQTPKLTAESDELSTATASAIEDTKNNLIDFEIFAEPEPLNKPTRFVR